MTNTSGTSSSTSLGAPTHPHVLEAIPRDTDDPDSEYTLVPHDAEGIDRMTRWITVDADGIVDLSTWR